MESLSSVHEMAELAARDASIREQQRRAMRVTGQEQWYIARPGRRFREDQAKDLFEENHCRFYSPKKRRMVKISNDRLTLRQRRSGIIYKESRLIPLMPYRFVWFDRRRQDWRDLFAEARIQGMIFSEQAGETLPVLIRDREIERMQSMEIDGAIPETVTVREWAFKVGEQVRVIESAYAGFPGFIEELPEKAIGDIDEGIMFKLTIWLFGRPNLVELPLSAIAKL